MNQFTEEQLKKEYIENFGETFNDWSRYGYWLSKFTAYKTALKEEIQNKKLLVNPEWETMANAPSESAIVSIWNQGVDSVLTSNLLQ